MKIRNLFFMLLTALFLASCSTDGSRTIHLDEFAAVIPESESNNIDDCKKMSELFSIVPGEYTISWKVEHEVPQLTYYSGTMVIKLRLNKKLSVKDEWIKEEKGTWLPSFALVDADGKEGKSECSWRVASDYNKVDYFNKDQFMDFVKFLQSEPGTEMEVPLGAYLLQNSDEQYGRGIDDIKNAKGIIMKVRKDSDFETFVAKISE